MSNEVTPSQYVSTKVSTGLICSTIGQQEWIFTLNLPHHPVDLTSVSPKFDIASQHFFSSPSFLPIHPSIHSAPSFEILADTDAFVWAKSE